MKAAILTAWVATLSSPLSLAEVWTGEGQAYDSERTEVGTFEVHVEVAPISPHVDSVETVIRTSRGSTITISCTIDKDLERWSKSCSDGFSGGGYYFDSGLATEYLVRGDQALAISITFDGEDSMRILITKLRNGRAEEFYTQSLVRSTPATNKG